MPLHASPYLSMKLAFALIAAALCVGSGRGATLEFAVRHTFNDGPLLLDSLRYQNAAGETLSVTRLSYLLSGFAVEREDGVWVEMPDLFAWMDAVKQRTSVRFEGVPEGKWSWQTLSDE